MCFLDALQAKQALSPLESRAVQMYNDLVMERLKLVGSWERPALLCFSTQWRMSILSLPKVGTQIWSHANRMQTQLLHEHHVDVHLVIVALLEDMRECSQGLKLHCSSS